MWLMKAYLGRILVVFGLENPEFGHPGLLPLPTTELRTVQACRFDSDEDPFGAGKRWLGIAVVEGETVRGWLGAHGGEHSGSHCSFGIVVP